MKKNIKAHFNFIIQKKTLLRLIIYISGANEKKIPT